jgi:hypothetical protein
MWNMAKFINFAALVGPSSLSSILRISFTTEYPTRKHVFKGLLDLRNTEARAAVWRQIRHYINRCLWRNLSTLLLWLAQAACFVTLIGIPFSDPSSTCYLLTICVVEVIKCHDI